jgi:hypothetical protein
VEGGETVGRAATRAKGPTSLAKKTEYACDILGEYFANATSLRVKCRQIIDKYLFEGCAEEIEMAVDDAEFFLELVRLRDSSRIPATTYVRKVLRSTRDGQVGRHVVFQFGDGSRDMIGWSKMCGGRPASRGVAINAMREAVRQQMQEAYIAGCDSAGDDAVVHHAGISFSEIAEMWLREISKTPEQLPLMDLFDGGGYTIAPGPLRESWREFHKKHATLVVVSQRWHIEHHAQERATKKRNAG